MRFGLALIRFGQSPSVPFIIGVLWFGLITVGVIRALIEGAWLGAAAVAFVGYPVGAIVLHWCLTLILSFAVMVGTWIVETAMRREGGWVE